MMQKLWILSLLCLLWTGCGSPKPSENGGDSSVRIGDDKSTNSPTPITDGPVGSSISTASLPDSESVAGPNDRLLASRLSPEQLEQGWIRLYDGHEMAGWFYIGNANWSFGDGVITVDGGDASLLCTNFQVSDFELLVDFKCSDKTESGIFLRSSADPRDLSRDCYALSIAPADSAFPTGSLVKRQKIEKSPELASNEWHTYRIIAQGDQIKAWLDGNPVLDYTDTRKLHRGYIALQHKLGVVRFRNVLMRPLGGKELALNEDWQNEWKALANSGKDFAVEATDSGLHLQSGPGQLESKEQWDDFILQANYQVASAEVDSGILFRALPERYNEAYECQIYDGPPPTAGDKQAKLQTGSLSVPIKGEPTNARVLASYSDQTTYVTIIADDGQFTTFVNGLLVADSADTRDASPNPRAGFRRQAGKLGLQAQDENCDILFKRLSIAALPKR